MKSRISQLSAAAVIIIAVIVGVNYLGGPIDGASIAWGKVLEKIDNAKTLTWKRTRIEQGNSTISRYMVLQPYSMRVEWPNRKVQISDHRQEKTLILDTTNKKATVRYAKRTTLNYYNAFLHFKDRSKPVKQISSREINGKQAIGFNLETPKGPNGYYGVTTNNEPIVDWERIVWVDSETLIPVLIEETFSAADGWTWRVLTDEIVFDAELLESLFSLEVPAGYELQYDIELYNREKSAVNMSAILKACAIYDNQYGQWPDSLQELDLPGINVSRFIYLKPSQELKGRRIVLYDAYDVWEDGINVGFANYRVEFIKDESEFQKLLELK